LTHPYHCQELSGASDKDKAGAMIQAINKQLKTRRIMRSLEKFVGGRPYEERFYTLVGNPVKEILLKLNLPDHRYLKDRGEGFVCFMVPKPDLSLESDLGKSMSLPQSLEKLPEDFLVEVEGFEVLILTLLKTQDHWLPQ
ncbi:hypothetical protein Tco_0195276, partial [Tanacetum coccineum]